MLNELWTKYRPPIISTLVLVIVIGIGYWRLSAMDARHQQAVQMTEKQMQDINVLQNELNLSKQNAAAVKDYFEKALANQVAPVNHFYVAAPTIDQAAGQVTDRINAKDPTLPPAALAPSDRTAVVTQPTNQQYQVGVYKINTYRNWEWSAGIGVHNGDAYIPIGLQRNYSKDAAIAGEIHLSTTGTVNGGELKYVRKTDKLFFIF
jgi:hypothetical protein